MFNPNSMNNSIDEHEDNVEKEALKTEELNKKLGSAANEEVSNGNLLRANDEISRSQNLKSLSDYLSDANIDPKSAEVLLATGVFSAFGSPADYRLSLWNKKDENGAPYLISSTRDELGRSEDTNHRYKVFGRNDFFVVYDSEARTEGRRYAMDDPIGSGEPSYYLVNSDQATLIDPATGKIIASGKHNGDHQVDSPADKRWSVMDVNNENIGEDFQKFVFEISDQEKFDELKNARTEDAPMFSKIEESVARQAAKAAEAEEKRKLQEEKKKLEEEQSKKGFWNIWRKK